MTEKQQKLINFIDKFFNENNLRLLSQKVHRDEELFKKVQEEVNFLVKEQESYLDTVNFEAIDFNNDLIKKQQLQKEDIENLVLLNILKLLVNKSILKYNKFNSEELSTMKKLGALIYPMEMIAQQLWKFDQDDTKHTWWYQLKACECPILDNQELFGIDRAYINTSCPIHGSKSPEINTAEK